MGQRTATGAFRGQAIVTQRGGGVAVRLPGRVSPDTLLHAVHHLPRPVLTRHLGRTIVAACPDEVATGASIWDALRRPTTQTGADPMAGGWMGLLGDRLAGTVELLPGSPPDGVCPRVIRSSLPGDLYLAAVERARELIRAGDVYQVNLVQRLDAEWGEGALALARALWAAAGDAAHRAYVVMDEGTVVSASPERMVASDGRTAWSEPIKGTAAPGGYGDLRHSVKDRAEHVMIVDLVRNDLGRVAKAGGVSVPSLMDPLATAYADHMVSQVRAELRDDAGPADVLRAVFPAGSVTGAPKVRALEVIREIEPVGRGPAFGSVVAVGTDGSLDASVTIRTAWVPTDVPRAQYWCGGAIVWDSDPVSERDEAWRKARPFLDALGAEAP